MPCFHNHINYPLMPAPTISQPLNFGQRLLFGLICVLIWPVSALPLCIHYLFSDLVLFPLVFHVAGYRRKIVQKNLHASFPEKTEAELKQIERSFYHWFCDYIVETLKLFSMSKSEMKRRITFEDLEETKRVLAEGKSIGLYLGHYCNWEWVSSLPLWVDNDMSFSQVYHVLESPVMDHLMLYIRARMGSENVSMQEILRYIIGKQRAHQPFMTGFIADQTPLWNSIHLWLPFLNHPETPVFTGTERLLKRFGLAAFYLDIRRVRRGYYAVRLVLMTEDTKDVPDFQLTEHYFRLLEANIRRQPELWLWSHNRWKRTREEFERRQQDAHAEHQAEQQ